MKYKELIILLPCHSLEDFPLHHEGDEAQGLLASWTALWHPALLAAAGSTPAWHRVDDPPEDLSDRLIVVPTVAQDQLQTGFAQRAKDEGACLVRRKLDRNEIVAQALEELDGGDGGVDADLAADFLALGYCYLQVELLTRQMRYSSNLDEVHFTKQTVAAAQALMQGETETAREKLAACFNVLAEERDHYYPVDAFLLNLTLMAPTTVGRAFREELAWPAPVNLLMSGDVLAVMAEEEPESRAALRAALESNSGGLIGGEACERRLPLLSPESILGEVSRGLSCYDTLLGRRPAIFGRRRYGLTPALPQILQKTGFQGALHATLDDGRFPEGMQIKTRWEGIDGAGLDALARAPLDATKPGSYLNLAVKMGESMDMDHVATVCLAHWPGQTSPWFDDLRRIARYCTALGKFVTIDQYFRETEVPYHSDRFTADQYRSPYLKQAIIRKHDDPISTSVRYWRRRAAADGAQSLSHLASMVSGQAHPSRNDLFAEIDEQAEAAEAASLDEKIAASLASAANDFATCLPRKDGAQQAGYLVTNPCSFVRRVGVEVPQLEGLPAIGKPIYAADDSHERRQVVVDVPPMGFVWVAPSPTPAKPSRAAMHMAEDLSQKEGYFILRNEFFEVLIDPVTGHLRSLYEYQTRGNRFSQQLALRLPGRRQQAGEERQDPDDAANYSVMAADSIEVTANSHALGEIVTKGRLMDREGQTLAEFEQPFQLWRGSRVLRLDIQLDPKVEPKADPWNSYYCCRFAWSEEASDLSRTLNQTRVPVSSKRIEAPLYIDIEGVKTRTAILTGGLPFHRQIGLKMLDTLLLVRGESARRFQLGVGIELTHPMHEALSLLAPPPMVYQTAAPPSPSNSSWLFHVDAKNVVATHWEPVVEGDQVTGFRVRLLETTGRPARVGLSCFREPDRAKQVNFRGEPLSDCKIEEGKIRLELAAHEWTEVEAMW